ncbi:S1 family peptidase [Streptomyces sp. NPDC005548]|uniref:S1 family peptidase n=1 Tax=Streptomyces sp. NPDC005548 TaxID=3364724 RepID=UPI0036C01BF3
MRHARRRIVRRGARFAAVGGLLCGGLMVTHAMASEPSDTSPATGSSVRTAVTTGAGLVSRLGTTRTAGTWVADDGRPVVAVTDAEAAAEVKRAGARPKVVPHSMRDLKSATQELSSAPRVPGTAWAVDYTKNEVVVQADSTVSASDWSRMTKLADGIGDEVRMRRTQGTFTTRVNGATAIFSTGGRCSAGFNVTNASGEFILTAGHCGPAGSVWFSDNSGRQQVGRTVTTAFPGSDFSLVQYDAGQAPAGGTNIVAIGGGNGVRINGAADPAVGQRVFRSGSTSGLRDGKVTALGATVNYPEGTVTGLIETTVCAEPGDSGGPLFSEGIALGVTSGGNGDCTSGGTTFFQPVTKALTALGVKLAGQAQGAGGAAAASSLAPSAQASAAPQGAAAAPGSAAPGAVEAVGGTGTAQTFVSRITDPRNVGPGLLVIAGSIIALVATRFVRSEQDRKAYRRQYSQSWG